jgi:hypothetical protein
LSNEDKNWIERNGRKRSLRRAELSAIKVQHLEEEDLLF